MYIVKGEFNSSNTIYGYGSFVVIMKSGYILARR